MSRKQALNYQITIRLCLHGSFKLPCRRHSHRPVELISQGPCEYLVDWHLAPLAPRHRDPRVHVVDLGGTQCYLFVFVSIAYVCLQLIDVFLPLLDARLDGAHRRSCLVLVLLFEPPLLIL